MTGFAFQKNATFEWNGAPFRVREITPDGELLLESLDGGALSLVQRQVLLADYENGRLHAVALRTSQQGEERQRVSRLPFAPSATARAEVARREHYVRAVCSDGEPVWAASLQPEIAKAAAELQDARPPSVITVRRWFLRYQADSRDMRFLIPRRRGRR